MGEDHPVVWVKQEGLGRVIQFSLGYSWPNLNVYQQSDNYLTKLLYGTMRYAAKDFVGCTDIRFVEYNPDATQSDPSACLTPRRTSSRWHPRQSPVPEIAYSVLGAKVTIVAQNMGSYHAVLADIRGKRLKSLPGHGSQPLEMTLPHQGGVYLLSISGLHFFYQSKIFIAHP